MESTQRDLAEEHTTEMQQLWTELAQARDDSATVMPRVHEVHVHMANTTHSAIGMVKLQLELEKANRTTNELKIASALNSLLQKIQSSETKSVELHQEMQEQRQEVKDVGEKINAVLTEMQTTSLQFDLTSGARTDLNAGNLEGANWNL